MQAFVSHEEKTPGRICPIDSRTTARVSVKLRDEVLEQRAAGPLLCVPALSNRPKHLGNDGFPGSSFLAESSSVRWIPPL